MLVQRRRRWADIVQMLYKCFVFVGYKGHGHYSIKGLIYQLFQVKKYNVNLDND